MKKLIIPILILSFLMVLISCSKDEEVEKLEQEMLEAETSDFQTDTTTEEMETPDTMAAGVDEYAMTPETTPEEEPMEPATSDYSGMGGYTIQIGAGSDYGNVNYLLQKFLNRGYDAFMTEAYINDELVYRLRIGNYDNLAEAKAVAMELRDKYSVKFWIDYNE